MEETLGEETVEKLFTRIREKFGEFDKESKKVNDLRLLEQGGKTCNKYIQISKKTARGSRYERTLLVEEFKRELNGIIRRKLAEAKSLPSIIEKW